MMKVQASALSYAIFISIIISVLSSFVILMAYNYNRYIDNILMYEQVKTNVNSAINYYIINSQDIKSKENIRLKLFDDETSNVDIKHKIWGMYSYIVVMSKWKYISFSKNVLLGDDIFSKEKISLYLADHKNYLSLSGNTIIKGISYIPKLGVKRAYIEGNSFTGNKIIDGIIKNSKKTLPEINKQIISYNNSFFNYKKQQSDSIINYDDFIKNDTIINSFANKTLIVEPKNDMSLSGKTIIGNIIIISKYPVSILKNNNIEDAIIYAPKITIMEGFKGNLQIFATNNIFIENNVNLLFPSSVVLLQKNSCKNSKININKNSKIIGNVILLNFNKKQNNKTLLHIHKDSKIIGEVYCNDMVQINGSVLGSLYADMFYLKTNTSVYENHILNAKIDFSELPQYYVGANLFNNNNSNKKIIKCLN